MGTEKATDLFIAGLLKDAEIDFTPEKSNIKEVQKALNNASKTGKKGVGFPEYIGKSNNFIIVVEDKADTNKQAKYCERNNDRLDMTVDAVVNYAENGALHYARHIVDKSSFKKVFAFGCSGDEKHHIIRPIFVDEYNYKILDEVENFKNFSEENIDKYYREIVEGETPFEVIEMENLLEKSKTLNEQLTFYGQVSDSEKPLVVSAILLALKENLDISSLTADDIKKDGDKIHDALCCNLLRVDVGDKREAILHQFNFIKDRTNLNTYDDRLGKTPLKYFTEYIKEEIFPSISNAHEDILGFFYGEFIKYSGGDGQSLGIVLTPKHITELFCDLLEIKPTDRVFDPCTGTASFLVSAMNKMLGDVETEEERKFIKANNIHGIEIREDMFAIASTNMILRGDGKSNLILGDFLKTDSKDLKEKGFTVGLMNPPYSQRKNKDTAHLSEIHFVKHLLDSLSDGARCGVIVPQSSMVGNNKEDKNIKKSILKTHTLEGVITLNSDTTFYRIGVNPCIAIFTANKPHPEEKRSKFINFTDDGYYLKMHVGISRTERAIERKEHLLQCWRDEKDVETKFMVKSKVKDTDEWLHSFYYFDDNIPQEKEFDLTMQKYLTFEFDMVTQGRDYLFKE